MISGIHSMYFKQDSVADHVMSKIRKATKGVRVETRPCERWLTDIKNRRIKQLKPSMMGWSACPREKSFIVVKLDRPIEAGITLAGGNRIYERVQVSSAEGEEGGEFLIRQLLTDAEARFLLKVTEKSKSGPVNVIMGGVRGLPRVTEFDECVLKITRSRYKENFRSEIGAFMMTLGHDYTAGLNEFKEEPMVMICLMDGNLMGADSLGRAFPPFQKGDPTIKQFIGSMETQLFLKLEAVVNRPYRTSSNSWMIEIDRAPRGSHIMDVVTSLDENLVSRALAFIRMDSDPRLAHDKWCAIMKTRGDSSIVKELGPLLVREKHITSPTKRSRVTTRGKTHIRADEGNIRFFERQAN
jgi:hypothetical protein